VTSKYRIFKRRETFYCEDRETGQQTSLWTRCRAEAQQLVAARNQAAAQPVLNRTMARAYLTASAPEMMTRTWTDVLKEVEAGYADPSSSRKRWQKFMRSLPISELRDKPLLTTENTDLLAAMRHEKAGVSTNKFLRMCHNRALDMGWLLAPIIAKKLWPKFRHKERRAIKPEEHQKLLAVEHMEDYRLFYELLWATGGSQSDIANLGSEKIDWDQGVLSFGRLKLRGRDLEPVVMAIGPVLEALLAKLPKTGPLFPRLGPLGEAARAYPSNRTRGCPRSRQAGVPRAIRPALRCAGRRILGYDGVFRGGS
jgi:integrase